MRDRPFPPGIGAFRQPRPTLSHVPTPWREAGAAQWINATGHFTEDAGFFHDGGDQSDIALCLEETQARLEARAFVGEYASLALALPATMGEDLSRDHDLRVALTLHEGPGTACPGEGYVRLSVDDAGALWQQSVPLPMVFTPQRLALGPGPSLPDPLPNATRRVWIDVVFTKFDHCSVILRSLAVTRAPMPVV